ncbi:MAG: hypothetical protein JWO15_137 [Sphingomonadales bacterium]|nr:hypothetical protein [Sphingomonadales bacterium]
MAEQLYLGMKFYELITIVALVLGPVSAVAIQLASERRRKIRELQSQTMRMLVSTRHMPSDAAYSTAINMIPLDFNKNKKVMAAWKDYIATITYRASPENIDEHNRQIISKQTALIFEIMKLLGYELSETDIQTSAYAAGGFIARDNLMLEGWRAWPRIAASLEAQTAILAPSADGPPAQEGQ